MGRVPTIPLEPPSLSKALEVLMRFPRLEVRVEGKGLLLLVPDTLEGGYLAGVVVPLPLLPGLDALFTSPHGPALRVGREALEVLQGVGIGPHPKRLEVAYARR